jgi:hypothetical protein
MREYVGLVSETRRLEANYNLGFAISSFHSFDRIVASSFTSRFLKARLPLDTSIPVTSLLLIPYSVTVFPIQCVDRDSIYLR